MHRKNYENECAVYPVAIAKANTMYATI